MKLLAACHFLTCTVQCGWGALLSFGLIKYAFRMRGELMPEIAGVCWPDGFKIHNNNTILGGS